MICENVLVSLVYLNLLKTWVQFGTGSFDYRHHQQSQSERPWLSMSVCFC